jgi:hypothetical protein
MSAPLGPVLPIPATLRYDSVDEHLRKLERLSRAFPDEPVELDWKHLATVDPGAGAIVATALLGSFADRRLVISLPEGEGQLEKLARVGLTFAIANRARSLTELHGVDPEQLDLHFWSRSWSRTADLTPVQETLFTPSEIGEEEVDLESAQFAAFVNPHLAGSGDTRTPAALRARPWLTRLLPEWRDRLSDRPIRSFLTDVNTIVSELVENVGEHALVRVDRCAPTTSLLKLALTGRRLYVTVQDNGPGIGPTARPKVELVAPSYAEKTDSEIIADLISGLIPGWGLSRGSGLAKVHKAVTAQEGSLRLISRKVRVATDDGLTPNEADFDLGGTVLIATLRLPGLS